MYYNNTTGNCLLRNIVYHPKISCARLYEYIIYVDINTDND